MADSISLKDSVSNLKKCNFKLIGEILQEKKMQISNRNRNPYVSLMFSMKKKPNKQTKQNKKKQKQTNDSLFLAIMFSGHWICYL